MQQRSERRERDAVAVKEMEARKQRRRRRRRRSRRREDGRNEMRRRSRAALCTVHVQVQLQQRSMYALPVHAYLVAIHIHGLQHDNSCKKEEFPCSPSLPPSLCQCTPGISPEINKIPSSLPSLTASLFAFGLGKQRGTVCVTLICECECASRVS